MTNTNSEHITPEQRMALVEALKRLGVSETAKRLGLQRETVLRIAGGFGSRPGSDALAVSRLGRLAE